MRFPGFLQPAAEQVGSACFSAFARLPNGPGYQGHKARLLRRMLGDEARLETFRGDVPLPPGYGVGVDERCIEYPWALLHLRGRGGRLLDAGSVLNNALLVAHPIVARHELHIMTLAPEPDCFWHRGVSYLFGDLRRNPIRDGFYDSVACLSTLEHVGCDNSDYSGRSADREMQADGYAAAVRELARVLRPGGMLLLTVPFGRHVNHGWFQVFDEAMVRAVVAAFGPRSDAEVRYFSYSETGWDASSAAACADAVYAAWMAQGPAHRFWPMREPDDAAAARAVACIRLVKA
jgi:SAM-dependent methyltransferase